jgi:DeoR/GlpR family transcriptional regulator of sugar metabolism|nr:MAG TPA: MerR family regulatory protein [Caudoviricetes sp.]
MAQLESAYNACLINGQVTVSDLAEYMDITPKTIRNYIKEGEKFVIKNGVIEKSE